ncbi:MAG TPA: hypothetical protein VE981_16705 [Planctomycetota bacterium]|nr:hypothetical protein [Planctomycetota bacterium]
MGREHDNLFAKQSIALKLLTPAQVMECREVQAELESAGIEKLLVVVAVDQGVLSRSDAARLVAAINQKAPGMHPALPGAPEAAPAAAPAKPVRRAAAPPPPPSPSAAPREARIPRKRPSKPAPAADPAGGSRKVLIAGAVGAVVAIGLTAVLLMSGGRSEAPPKKREDTAQVKPDPPPAPPPPPSAKVESAPAPPRPPPPPKPEPEKESPPQNDGRKAFEERLAEKKKEARARYEEALKEVVADRKAADEAAQAAKQRLAGKTVTLTLASGAVHRDAAVKSWNYYDADLEVGGKAVHVKWEEVQPSSLLATADLLFDPRRPQDQFDRGQYFIARRMWKEAQSAFSAAAKFGQGFESRVLEFTEVLDRLVSGQGGFRGRSRRIGRDVVRLSWDFREDRQLEDFSPGMALSNRGVVLDSAKKAVIFLTGGASGGGNADALTFLGQLSADLKITCDEGVTFHLFAGEAGAYELDLGPAGAALFKTDPTAPEKNRRRLVGRSDKVRLPAGKSADVRLFVRHPRFRVLVDGAEALAVEDGPVSLTAEPPRGAFGWSIEKGRLRIEAPLAVQGRADAAELDRRMNDTEVMVRRALDPDLEQIERARELRKAMKALGETKELVLSSDDPYFVFRIGKFEDITKYEELKKTLGDEVDLKSADRWKTEVTALIAKYRDVPSLYYLRALFSHDHQDSFGALADLRKSIELFPDFYEALALQSRTLLRKQEPKLAAEAIRRALEVKPDYIEGLVILAQCLRATTSDAEGLMETLDVVRHLDSRNGEAAVLQRVLKYQRLGPRELGCRFDVETEHYRITTDISAAAAKQYGENLEAAFRHYSASFAGDPARPVRAKPRVAIFNTAENYYTYFELLSEERGENTLGVFRPSLNEFVLFESTEIEETYQTLYHEAVHHFATLLTPYPLPYWFSEGTADYMGGIEVKDGKVVAKARIQKTALPYAKLAIGVNADLPFERIMNETPREFYSGNMSLKYSQAWSMIYFFYEYEKGRYRGLIEEYFELIRQGRSPRECFDAVFKAKTATLEREWREFTKGLQPRP